MNSSLTKASRGRPKTLSRSHILDVAMQVYWERGIGSVSINELCKLAKVSKPGLYREFGNEDGLMMSVLAYYEEKVLAPLTQMLAMEAPFTEILDNMIEFVTAERSDPQFPKGCLFVNMRESKMRLGEATRKQIEQTLGDVQTVHEKWVERAREKGEFTADMSTTFAATYIYAQVSYALSQIMRGEDNVTVRNILITSLSVVR